MQRNPKHFNKVRIIAGSHGSRWVKFPDVDGLRPTSDMIREKVFNWLGQYLYGQKVLDLFAGSGIFSFESASRGASYIVAIESNSMAYQALQNNRKELELFDIHPIQQDALSYFQTILEKFDVIFLDPPYAWREWPALLECLPLRLKHRGYAYVELGQAMCFPNSLEVIKQGKSGKSYYYLVVLNQQ